MAVDNVSLRNVERTVACQFRAKVAARFFVVLRKAATSRNPATAKAIDFIGKTGAAGKD